VHAGGDFVSLPKCNRGKNTQLDELSGVGQTGVGMGNRDKRRIPHDDGLGHEGKQPVTKKNVINSLGFSEDEMGRTTAYQKTGERGEIGGWSRENYGRECGPRGALSWRFTLSKNRGKGRAEGEGKRREVRKKRSSAVRTPNEGVMCKNFLGVAPEKKGKQRGD